MVIVTGASRGIGAAIATLLASRGSAVAVNYSQDRAGAENVVAGIQGAGGKAVAIACDVSKVGEVILLFESAERELGRITGIVNNAAITGGFARVGSW